MEKITVSDAAQADHQGSYDSIFGSGATGYGWWEEFSPMHPVTKDGAVPSYWGYRVKFEDADDEGPVQEAEVYHQTLLDVMEKIANGEFDDRDEMAPGRTAISETAKAECIVFLADPDSADFDADTADQVLQCIAYGGVVFG